MEKIRPAISELPYSAGLMSQSCWFIEFKKIVQLIAVGKTDEEIKAECLENNLLGAIKEYRAKRMYGYLVYRAGMLDEQLLSLFMSGDLGTQKIINLIAILRGDRLFFEFLYEVYRENILMGQPQIEDADVSLFFHNKDAQSEIVAGWNESTKKHLKSNYFSCMTDANLIRIEGKKRLITKPILDTSIIDYLKKAGDHSLLAAIAGVAV